MSSKSELLNKEKSLNEEPLKTHLVVLKKILKLRCPTEDEEVLEAERKLPSLKRKGGNQPEQGQRSSLLKRRNYMLIILLPRALAVKNVKFLLKKMPPI